MTDQRHDDERFSNPRNQVYRSIQMNNPKKKERKKEKIINKKKEEITRFICTGQSYALSVNVLSYVVRFRRHRRDRRYRLILRGVQLRRRGRRKACVAQERGFQPKKGRSAPHIPPVVSAGLGATEPLRGSTIRRAQWCSTDLVLLFARRA